MNKTIANLIVFIFFVNSNLTYGSADLPMKKEIIWYNCNQSSDILVCDNWQKYNEVKDLNLLKKIKISLEKEKMVNEFFDSIATISKKLGKYVMSSDTERLRMGKPQFNPKHINGAESYKMAKAVSKALEKSFERLEGVELTAQAVFDSFDPDIKQHLTYDYVKSVVDMTRKEAMAERDGELNNAAIAGAIATAIMLVAGVVIGKKVIEKRFLDDDDDDEDEDEDETRPAQGHEEGPKLDIRWPKPKNFGNNGDSDPRNDEDRPLSVSGKKPVNFNEEIVNPGDNNGEIGPPVVIEIPPVIPQQVEDI